MYSYLENEKKDTKGAVAAAPFVMGKWRDLDKISIAVIRVTGIGSTIMPEKGMVVSSVEYYLIEEIVEKSGFSIV